MKCSYITYCILQGSNKYNTVIKLELKNRTGLGVIHSINLLHFGAHVGTLQSSTTHGAGVTSLSRHLGGSVIRDKK